MCNYYFLLDFALTFYTGSLCDIEIMHFPSNVNVTITRNCLILL